ncbi:MAG TPA: LysM peptidoglycan-binding domain-containing protein [Anaerolineaceae bacterium]|nr:LysM peptidoglycan-binding domain-containing protein [Anaerolineaceae bacterium]HOG76918.1 LysM peptidoglycan-binding domain-containing protein [Anaerolineaceae bacterium]
MKPVQHFPRSCSALRVGLGRLCVALTAVLLLGGCYRPIANYDPWQVPQGLPISATPTLLSTQAISAATELPRVTITPAPSGPTPTPNSPALLPTLRTQTNEYTVVSGDSLARIALRHQVSVGQILASNPDLKDPNLIEPGQKLIIPPASANELSTNFKIIPDSELFYSPSAVGFDTISVAAQFGGKLNRYSEKLEDGTTLRGAEIVQRVADEFSVNPRLLLAVLEYRSGWVSSEGKTGITEDYPLGLKDANRKGLYKQLSWAANEMTRGYTLWELSAVAVWTLSDGAVMRVDATINGATAGIQYLLSLLLDKAEWKTAVSPDGFFAVYQRLFGFPFAFSIDPLIPETITQPQLTLPFAPGDTWYFTGGPHVGWGTGSANAGIDFAPPGEEFGCYESQTPVVAAADGLVVRSGNGVVVQDLDGDGIEQTGWSLLYLHINTDGRAAVGTYLRQGDLLGYPSCEGGYSTGTHLHLARRYNGAWISADGTVPFVLSGWTSESAGIEYDGFLVKNGQTVEAFNGRADFNAIGR